VSETAYLPPEEVRQLFARALSEEGYTSPAASGSSSPAAVRVTPWARHIVQRFVFDWWEDLDDEAALAAHCDPKTIHRMGECASAEWRDPSEGWHAGRR
jgi:hypothetical protein